MGVPADQLLGDGVDHVADVEAPQLCGHLCVIDRLQDQIAEFLAQVVEILALDGIGHLVGLLDGVVPDGREILLEIPGAARLLVAQRGHDLDEAGEVAGGLHGFTREDD